jgi:hypothetical protein
MLIWTFFLVLVRGTRAQNLSTPFCYTLFMSYSIYLCVNYSSLCDAYAREDEPKMAQYMHGEFKLNIRIALLLWYIMHVMML